MPLIDYPKLDELDEATRAMLDRSRAEDGTLAAFPHMLANNPAILGPALGQFGEVMYGGNLEPDLKQLAFVVVSQENECAYCAASHGSELVESSEMEATHLEALAEGDDAGGTVRQRAVVEFARQGATDPKQITDDHVGALRAVGFDDADVIEILTVVAQAAFANTIADAVNIRPGDQSTELEQYLPEGLSAPVSEVTDVP